MKSFKHADAKRYETHSYCSIVQMLYVFVLNFLCVYVFPQVIMSVILFAVKVCQTTV